MSITKNSMGMLMMGMVLGVVLSYVMMEISRNCWVRTSSYLVKRDIIRVLVRQASRWSVAARQDSNPLIAVLHANYGAGYLWALKDIATDEEIRRATNLDVIKFIRSITRIQDQATHQAVQKCPHYSSAKDFLSKLAGER